MFRLGCLALAIGGACLAACDAPRPVGAFTPAYDDPDDHFARKNDAAVAVAVTKPRGDAGTASNTGDPSDTGDTIDTSGMDEPTGDRSDGGAAPADVTPSEGPLAGLVGNYLVRMDNYSSATATKDGTTLKVSNRVSNLFVVKLTAQDDGTLLGREFLCDQTYWNSCDMGCTGHNAWQTTLDDRVPKFFASRVIDRTYTVDSKTGTLEAKESAIALGFDAGEGGKIDPKAALPTDKSDSHVWHLDSSDSADPVGVRTRIKVDSLKSAPPLTLTQALDCTLSSVQIYATKFNGQLDLNAKSPLDGKSFSLDTTGSSAQSLVVTPNDTGSRTYCTKANLDGTTPADAVSWVRFKRYTGVNCPADFETKFPGSTVSSM